MGVFCNSRITTLLSILEQVFPLSWLGYDMNCKYRIDNSNVRPEIKKRLWTILDLISFGETASREMERNMKRHQRYSK
jgi:hypothetical protein